MATAVVGAAFSVVGKALAPLTDGLLKVWAASVDLGDNVDALEHELKLVKILLGDIVGKEIENEPLKDGLQELQELAYDAEDVLDELDYFRIQDELDGTFHAADKHAKGVTHNLALNVRHTAKAVAKQIWLPACFSAASSSEAKSNQDVNRGKAKLNSRSCCNPIHAVGKCFPCSSLPSVPDDDDDDDDGSDNKNDKVDYGKHNNSPQRNLITNNNEPVKLRFNRVDASKRMLDIVNKLRPKREDFCSIIATLGSNWRTVPNIAQSRPVTFESTEQNLYGRDLIMNNIIHDITKGKHSTDILTVIPIVGSGGIGKTTLAQHIHQSPDVQDHFDVRVWTCVSLNFNVNKLLTEIEKYIPKVDGESSNGTASELIGQRLKNKRLLLVLDDIWDCSDEDEWKQLLVPFQKSQVQGNIIIVTTRFPAQAQIMVQRNDQPIYLQGLENKEFEELLLEIIFGDDDQSIKDHTFLLETGFKIAGRLKGSPLAAKTVGRLLKTQLDLVHWTRILESKEWEHSSGKNDIMPALKLSFDYLPSQLQLCFSYCALFPQDYRFERGELINFWIGQEALHSSHGENKRVEDIGLIHLTELVSYGFLENKEGNNGTTCYIIHDLLHELARKVSSIEFLSLDSSQSQVSSLKVLPSIRHLSINIDDTSIKDRLPRKNFVEDFNTLGTRLKVEKLRTLMIFGEHHGCFVNAFGDLFREAKALRVIFLSKASYDVECLLCNFYSLLHLRYLRIESYSQYEARFPNKISRFYHMVVIDAIHCHIIDLPRDITNLVKLHHLLVRNDRIHSSIVDVGKLKSLQELRRFMVKQEDQGFELKQIGHLKDLCELSIYNLQNVQVKEEADEAKLLPKNHLQELILHWDNIDRSTDDSTLEEYVLERLKPSSNLLKLSIEGHRGVTCPSWLGTNLSIKSLEYLCLDGVAWETFPPIGELLLVNVPRDELSGNIPKERFGNLKKLELRKLTKVEKWAVHAPCQLFPLLEVLIIKDCPQLVGLSFQHIACCQQGKGVDTNLFPKLSELKITNCPQLLSFPPVPWSEAPCYINIQGIGISCLDGLFCRKTYNLKINGKNNTTDSTIWNVLAFHNLTGLKELSMDRCQFMPLRYLQMLSFLRKLDISSCRSNTFPFTEADSHAKYQFPVESLVINEWNASGKELTQLLVYFPKLSDLELRQCKNVTGLAVNVRGQHRTETPGPSSPASEVEQQQGARAEDDVIVAPGEAERGLLLLPPQLQELNIWNCPELSLLCSNPHDDSKEEDGWTSGGGGLRGLTSLRRLRISDCDKILSAYSSSSFASSFPFPNSLQHLVIQGAVGTGAPVFLSNLTALTSLYIYNCGELRGEGLLSLLTEGNLTQLSVGGTPNFFVDSEPSQVHELEIPLRSSKLQDLRIDDVAGFTVAFIHRSLLFSSLTKLEISRDNKLERFTEQQGTLLFVNSLEHIRFYLCENLQALPEWLHGLRNLKRLDIWYCGALEMLPSLPSSLELLDISFCPKIQSLTKDCLPDSLRELEIASCPAIRSLPEVYDLPGPLRKLDVSSRNNSEELRRQCSKLINIIPIVRV